jgi:hypothetical protein
MKLYEAILYGLVTYAGAAGFLWFHMQATTDLPVELRYSAGQPYGALIYFSRLSAHGRISLACSWLSLLAMFGGMMLLFGLAATIPPRHGPYAVTQPATSSPSAQRD